MGEGEEEKVEREDGRGRRWMKGKMEDGKDGKWERWEMGNENWIKYQVGRYR